ncbi:unnamed protein product [Brassica rapa]|uniref:Uncharacterized protein n=1 Tax=Brassica campestris TaxID=3711 RepID=A0A3P6BGA5_BRACM|nr:unnamed protein product [Brassica rapa]VDD05037.1 unnamed protein product [Brassica rapa]
MRFVSSKGKKDSKRRRSWWERFFFDDDDVNWLGLRDSDIINEIILHLHCVSPQFDCLVCAFAYRYVKTVPLAAKTLDVRRSQKLKLVLANLRIFLMMIYGCVPHCCCFLLAEEEVREPESICQHMV